MNRFYLVVILILQHLLHLTSAQDLTVGDSRDITRVAGIGLFLKTCDYGGTDSSFDRLVWQLNGTTVESRTGVTITGGETLTLDISPPQLMDYGEYSCVAQDTNGQVLVEAVSAGFLSVFDSSVSIFAPSTQYVVSGDDITLQCSSTIPGSILSWVGPPGLPMLTNVSFQSRTDYQCNIIHSSTIIYTATIFLEVIVPPTIVTFPVIQDTYMNDPTTITLMFMSSFGHSTTVRWLKDNLMLSGDDITTAYTSDNITGSTALSFSPHLNRADMGRYSIIIENSMTMIPMQRRRVDFNFTINVVVPPAPPSRPCVVMLNNTLTMISWNLTNTTADAGPERIIVLVTNHPDSPITLPPSTLEFLLPTEPGTSYVVTIAVMNVDDYVESQPEHLDIPFSAPLISTVSAIRLNETTFNFSLQVVYTGAGLAGALNLVNIMFGENGSQGSYFLLASSVELMMISSQHWYGILSDSQFANITEVRFLMTTQNSMGLGVPTQVVQSIAVPGSPESITLLSKSSNSLKIQIKLSLVGSAPILSTHLMITASQSDENTAALPQPRIYNATENLLRGGLVVFDVEGLSPDTSYSVVVYATNTAGKGVDSRNKIFITSAVSILHSWIIVIVVVVSSLVIILIFVFFLVLISCVCRRRNDRKINLSSTTPKRQFSQSTRPGPIGASDSVDSLHTSNYAYSQKGFMLSPAPQGALTPRTGSFVSPYHYSKQHLRGDSTSDSDNSEPSSSKIDHFNFRHSPAPPTALLIIDEMEYSRSMQMLDEQDPDLSPTMPPDCATDV